MDFIDAHCHLSDERLNTEMTRDLLQTARQMGIGIFVQGGVEPNEWRRQIALKEDYPQNIVLCFGLHPVWVATHEDEECETALNALAPLLPKAHAIGEMGLDFRPQYRNHTEARQIENFENQLELAEASGLPMVLHLVQAHEMALRIFDIWGVPQSGGIAHSFNGSAQKAEDLMRRGLSLSIGGPVTYQANKTLRTAVEAIPMERLMLETDSPDQPPFSKKGQLHGPASLWEVAEAVAGLKKLEPEEILQASTANIKRILRLETDAEGRMKC